MIKILEELENNKLSSKDIINIFNSNKSNIKEVIDEYNLDEKDMINNLIAAVRDYEENTGSIATKEDVIDLMLDPENQW